MSRSKHTPGPWRRNWDDSPWCPPTTRLTVEGPGGELVAIINSYPPGDEPHEIGCGGDPEANARLIAAAPELLAACRALLDFVGDAEIATVIAEQFSSPDEVNAAVDAASAAIARAEGDHADAAH